MNPTLGILQERFGLAPSVVSGLYNAAGYADPPQANGAPPVDPSLPAEVYGTDPGDLTRQLEAQTGKKVQGPTDFGNAQPEAPKGAGPVAVQGPEEDKFPTVRPFDDYGNGASGGAPTSGVAIPAHWQNTTHETTQEGGMRPEYAQDYGKLRNSQLKHEENADNLALQDAAVRGISSGIAKRYEDYVNAGTQDKLRNMQEQRNRYIEGQQQAAEQALSDARKTIDPDQLWKGNTFGRVLAAVAVGLGQFGASLTHTENGALKIIDSAIQNNIDAQKANIANARNRYRDLGDEKAKRLGDFDDLKQQELVHRAMLLDDSARMVEEWNAKNGFKDQAAAEQLLAGIQKRRADALKDFAAVSDGKFTEKSAEKFVPMTMSGGGVDDKKDHGELYVPTLGGYARSKEVAEKLNSKGAARMQIGESLHQIYGLLDEADKKGISSPLERDRIDTAIQQRVHKILTRSTVLEGQGAMSEGDKDVQEMATGLYKMTTQGMPSAVLKRKMDRIKDVSTQMLEDHRIEGEAYGVRSGTEKYVQGPNGPTPVRVLEGRNKTVSKRTEAVDDLVQPPKGVPNGR